MGMADPKPQYSYLVEQLRKHRLAYIHIVEPMTPAHNNDFLRDIWGQREGSIYISTSGHDRKSAIETADNKGGLVGFGRMFISNVSRLVVVLDLVETDVAPFFSPTFHSAC
jgi:NADPH2 dehydrogenase